MFEAIQNFCRKFQIILFIFLAAWPELVSAAPRPVNLAIDEGPHDAKTEWWYYSGTLNATDGSNRKFGFRSIIGSIGKVVGGRGKVLVAHSLLIESAVNRLSASEKRQVSIASGDARESAHEFKFGILQPWKIRVGEGTNRIYTPASEFTLDLELETDTPAKMMGDEGVLQVGNWVVNYYFKPRMNVRGRVFDGKKWVPVEGRSYMEHQWGESDLKRLKWSWFQASFETGDDLVFYRVWDRVSGDILQTSAIVMPPDGKTRVYMDDDVDLHEMSTESVDGVVYPSKWVLLVPRAKLHLSVESSFLSQRIPLNGPAAWLTGSRGYWEGMGQSGGSFCGSLFRSLKGPVAIELFGHE